MPVEFLLCAFSIKMQDVSSMSRSEVMRVHLAPYNYYECEIGINCPPFIQVGTCACPQSPRLCPWYWGCIYTPLLLCEKTGGPYCYHWPSPASWRLLHIQSLQLVPDKNGGVGNDLFCLVWKQSSSLTEYEWNRQGGICCFQGAILSNKGFIGSINYETSVVPSIVADWTSRISYFKFSNP